MRDRRGLAVAAVALLSSTLCFAAQGARVATVDGAQHPVVHADARSAFIAEHLAIKGKDELLAPALGKTRFSSLSGVRYEMQPAEASASGGRRLATSAPAGAATRGLAGFGKALEPVILRDKKALGDFGAEHIVLTHGWTVEVPFPAEVRHPAAARRRRFARPAASALCLALCRVCAPAIAHTTSPLVVLACFFGPRPCRLTPAPPC